MNINVQYEDLKKDQFQIEKNIYKDQNPQLKLIKNQDKLNKFLRKRSVIVTVKDELNANEDLY
jgi:hypothetical protein